MRKFVKHTSLTQNNEPMNPIVGTGSTEVLDSEKPDLSRGYLFWFHSEKQGYFFTNKTRKFWKKLQYVCIYVPWAINYAQTIEAISLFTGIILWFLSFCVTCVGHYIPDYKCKMHCTTQFCCHASMWYHDNNKLSCHLVGNCDITLQRACYTRDQI